MLAPGCSRSMPGLRHGHLCSRYGLCPECALGQPLKDEKNGNDWSTVQDQQLHRLKTGQQKQLRAGLLAAQTLHSHRVRPKAVRNLLGAAEAAEALATAAAAARRPAAPASRGVLIEYCCDPGSRLARHVGL